MPKLPRGTRDFAPAEMAWRRGHEATMREVFRRAGFREVQTPTFEELELFTAKSGEGIISELYNFEDKGGRRMTLRPELTAPVMRMMFQDHAFDPKPIKWFYFGNCFRYDRPQKGRYREFWQFGCEQVGAGTPLAYAELITLADRLLEAVGLEGRDVRVGHVGLLGHLVDALGLAPDPRGALMRAIDKGDDAALKQVLDQASGVDAGAADTLRAALGANDLAVARDAIGDHEALDELDAVFAALADFKVEARLHLGIARGLDYYTGTVFEIHAPALEAQSQLAGGGGYDLSAVFDAQPVPTMGFGLGFDRTLVALEAQGVEAEAPAGPAVYFGALGDEAQGVVTRGVNRLRSLGVSADLDLMARKPQQIAKAADAAGARYLVIVGDRDIESGTVTAKELATGDATELPIDAFVDWLIENTGGIDMRDYN